MVKKVTISIVILLIMCTSTVFAGDIPESLMAGEQKALFIGEIVSTNEQKTVIKPLTIMMGSISVEEISVDSIDEYYGTNNNPTTGDYVVVVLLSDNEIDDSWFFKATSSDYKTLELVSEKYNMVERYNEYINSGAYLEAQERIDKEKKETSTSTTGIENIVEKREIIEHRETDSKSNKIKYGIIICGALLLAIIIFSHKKRNNRNNK